jgi:hypothetical protein
VVLGGQLLDEVSYCDSAARRAVRTLALSGLRFFLQRPCRRANNLPSSATRGGEERIYSPQRKTTYGFNR